jgi:hypothetical protein
MACTKNELVVAINAFASARVTNDPLLSQFAAQNLDQKLNSLEFGTEQQEVKETEVVS